MLDNMNAKQELKIAQAIGKALALYRKKTGLTQDQVAEKLDVERETVSRFERGAVIPPIPRLYELADIYGCAVDDLLALSSSRTPDQIKDIAKLLDGMDENHRKLAVAMIRELSIHLK